MTCQRAAICIRCNRVTTSFSGRHASDYLCLTCNQRELYGIDTPRENGYHLYNRSTSAIVVLDEETGDIIIQDKVGLTEVPQ